MSITELETSNKEGQTKRPNQYVPFETRGGPMLAIQKIEFFRYIFEIYREGRKNCSGSERGRPF